jgi:type IV secretory pathway VirB3-like protein
MKFIIIALVIVVVIWLMSRLIHVGDKRTREKLIKKHQEEKQKERDRQEQLNKPTWLDR